MLPDQLDVKSGDTVLEIDEFDKCVEHGASSSTYSTTTGIFASGSRTFNACCAISLSIPAKQPPIWSNAIINQLCL